MVKLASLQPRVGLSLSEPCVQDSGGPRERPVTYSGPLQANTVLCSFNTIHCFSFYQFNDEGYIFDDAIH